MLTTSETREWLLNVRRAYLPVAGPQGTVYFTSDAGGHPQVHRLSTSGSPGVPLVRGAERQFPVAMTARGLLVRHDTGGNELWQLSVLRDDELRPLTADPAAKHESLQVHPSGRSAGIAHNPDGQDDLWLGVLDLETGSIDDWLRKPGYWQWSAWSPDGLTGAVSLLTSPTTIESFLLDRHGNLQRLLPGTRRVTDLTWTRAGFIYALTDLESEFMSAVEIDPAHPEKPRRWLLRECWDLEAFVVDPAQRTALAVLNEGGYHRLWTVNLASCERSAAGGLPDGVVFSDMSTSAAQGIAWSEDGTTAYVAWETPTRPSAIYELATPRPLISFDGGRPVHMVHPESTSYRSFDGLSIPAFFYRVDDRPRPTVVYFHGGPESQQIASFQSVFQLFLQRGLNVFAPNVRGSTGYGVTYFSLDDRERRWNAVRDGCEAAHHLKRQGLATRVAAFGRSYGGFMTLAVLVAEPELWSAAVEHVGIADWHSFLKNTSGWRRAIRIAEYGDPNGPESEFLVAISPLRSADLIKTPLLVVHGRNDPRVPVSETEQIARATGAETLIFDDEGHGISRRHNMRLALERTVDFLAEQLHRA